MTPDQAAADRERIAGRCKAQPGRWWIADEFHELGNAVRAFATLCEPRGGAKACLTVEWLARNGRRAIVMQSWSKRHQPATTPPTCAASSAR